MSKLDESRSVFSGDLALASNRCLSDTISKQGLSIAYFPCSAFKNARLHRSTSQLAEPPLQSPISVRFRPRIDFVKNFSNWGLSG